MLKCLYSVGGEVIFMSKLEKKLLIALGVLCLGGIGGHIYSDFESGTDYYLKVTAEPLAKREKRDDENNVQENEYFYRMTGFDSEGNEKNIEFTVSKDRPLKKKAYIKLRIHDKKGPLRWEEVTKEDIPDAALIQLK